MTLQGTSNSQRITITPTERRLLLAVLSGAQDDDEGWDKKYTNTLTSLVGKVKGSS